MDTKELKALIENVLAEMNVSGAAPNAEENVKEAAPAPVQVSSSGHAEEEPVLEDGCLEDITAIDVKKQYLVKNPRDREGFYELKQFAPCRLGIGKAGARYKTLPQLMFRAAHSAAQDAVFSDVDQDFVDGLDLFTVQSRCNSKDEYLTRPDLGRRLNEESVKIIKEKCNDHPTVQIFVSDGLSSAAVAANTEDVLPGLLQGLRSNGIKVGKIGRAHV